MARFYVGGIFMRLLLVDDHELSRLWLISFLTRQFSDAMIETTRSLQDARQRLASSGETALVLVDSSIWQSYRKAEPQFSFRLMFPGVPVVVTRCAPDADTAATALADGAAAFVPRTAEPHDILTVLNQLYAPGRTEVRNGFDRPRSSSSGASGASSEDDGVDTTVLTPREREVVILLLRGKTNKEIGHSLSISDGTVKAHVHKIMCKLSARNRIDLANKFHVNKS